MRPSRGELEERVVDGGGVGQQQATLAEIVQDEGRQHHSEAREPDRQATEMAHVGIHRLATGDGREDRHGRRNRPVAVKQGGADETDDEEDGAPGAGRCMPGAQECQHGHDAALAVFARAHHEHGILGRHDEDQRPQHEGDRAHHGVGPQLPARGSRLGSFLEGVERAGADIAVDDAECAERHGRGCGAHLRAGLALYYRRFHDGPT